MHQKMDMSLANIVERQVAIDKVVKHKIIYRSRDKFGKACVVERIGTFCSGECAYNQQCAYEG